MYRLRNGSIDGDRSCDLQMSCPVKAQQDSVRDRLIITHTHAHARTRRLNFSKSNTKPAKVWLAADTLGLVVGSLINLFGYFAATGKGARKKVLLHGAAHHLAPVE